MADQSNVVLAVLLKAVDNISGPVKRVQARMTAFGRQVKAIGSRAGFDRLAGSLQRVGRSTRNLVTRLGSVAKKLTLIGAGGVAAVTGAVVSLANMGDKLAHNAQQMGMNVEALQELHYAAEIAGISHDSLDSSLQRFTRRAAQAADGGGAAKDAIADLGLSARALSQMSPDKALDAVADALTRVKSPADRLRFAYDLFGRSGQAMVNMLDQGSAGLAQMRQRARDLGLVLEEDAVDSAGQFAANMVDLKAALTGVRNVIGAALLPVFARLSEQFTALVVRYQPQIRAWVQSFAEQLPARLHALQRGISQVVEAVESFVDVGRLALRPIVPLVDHIGRAKVAVGLLAAVIVGPLIASFVSAAWAIGAFGVTLMLTPIGWILAGITAIALGARYIYKHWGGIKAWFADLWERVTAAFGHAIDVIGGVLQSLNPLALISTGFNKARQWLASIDWRGAVASGWNLLKAVFRWTPTGILARGFGKAREWLAGVDWRGAAASSWDGVKTVFRWSPLGLISAGFNKAREWLAGIDWREAAGPAWGALKFLFRWSPLGLMQEGFGTARDWLSKVDWSGLGKRIMQTLIDGLKSMASGVKDAVTGAFGKVGDGIAGAGKSVKEATGRALQGARRMLPFSDAKEGPLSALTQSGRAIPETLARGVVSNRSALDRSVEQILTVPAARMSGAVPRAMSSGANPLPGAQRPAASARASGGLAPINGGIHVGRVDFRPSVVIQAGAQADAQDISNLVQEQMERWRQRDLWEQAQRVQEGAV